MCYRELTEKEIIQLENQGCRAEDWSLVEVADNFDASNVRMTSFVGQVRIGEGCHINNVGCISTTDSATFGEGITISVLNEAGDGNVMFYSDLSSQMAALMVHNADNEVFTEAIHSIIKREVASLRPVCTTIGNGVTLSFCREITNVNIGDDCEIVGAARLVDCTLRSTPEASIFIGDGVICENVIVQAGSSIVDGARLYDTFVGETCHVGRSFTSENSLFFANSHMDNGESCAALCGPFSVSHHKSSLLIGGEYSFYNAGSGTNFSNHAYKLGPIHYGTLQRGSKTASGAHTLWPAQVGTFSMLMGKIQTHPDTRKLPFSYLIAHDTATYLVPGRNITTVGTYRDIMKWPQRDRRPRQGRLSHVQMDWLNPLVVGECIEGRKVLMQLRQEQGENVAAYQYNGVIIKNSSLQKGIRYYDMAIRMCLAEILQQHEATLPQATTGAGEWTDLLGLLAPTAEVERIIDDVCRGELSDINDIAAELTDLHNAYEEQKWAWAYRVILDYANLDTLTEADRDRIIDEYAGVRQEWLSAIRYDAEREYELGDVSQDMVQGFINKLK